MNIVTFADVRKREIEQQKPDAELVEKIQKLTQSIHTFSKLHTAKLQTLGKKMQRLNKHENQQLGRYALMLFVVGLFFSGARFVYSRR